MEGTSEELLEDTRARMTRMGGYEGGSCRGTSPMFICPSPGSLVALQPACKVSGEGRAETLSLLYILIGKALTCSSIPKAGKGVGASLPPPSRPSCRFSTIKCICAFLLTAPNAAQRVLHSLTHLGSFHLMSQIELYQKIFLVYCIGVHSLFNQSPTDGC